MAISVPIRGWANTELYVYDPIPWTSSKGWTLSWKIGVSIAGTLAFLGSTDTFAFGKPEFQSGVQMGYNYGENGVGFPSWGKDPLGNSGRAGFYLTQLRLKASVDFDSTFSAVAVGNVYFADFQEVYLEKRVRNYTFTAGKFRGAGLKSATGMDEFERLTVNAPRSARVWSHHKRLHGFRDFGLQIQADYFGGNLKHRFFVHNANRENVLNDEPSFAAGPSAQAVGFDYALDWRISPYTVWGGHMGALANNQWSEFIGPEEGWKVGNWFRSNPILDASLNHQLDMGRFHMFNETQFMINRTITNPVDGRSTRSWGVTTRVKFDHTRRTDSFFQYELLDPTDGAVHADNLHMFTLGLVFRPSPEAYRDLKLTTEYVRTMESGFENTVRNDLFICQLQMLF